MRTYIIIASLAILLGAALLIKVRRELPYNFDIVRTKDGVAIINVETWVKRELNVTLDKGGKILAKGVIDPESHSALIENIGAPGASQITISRIDLKGRLLYKPKKFSVNLNGQAQDYIILVGASIGYHWNLPQFPERIKDDRFALGDRIKNEFDKTDLIQPIFKYKIKPKAVIIKECSAYFPRDIKDSEKYRQEWVEQLRGDGIIPVIATTTPVGKSPENEDQQASIDEWNKSIRKNARQENYHILDLAAALRTSILDTYLKPGYFVEDGLHMTPLAYKEGFDPALKDLLDDII